MIIIKNIMTINLENNLFCGIKLWQGSVFRSCSVVEDCKNYVAILKRLGFTLFPILQIIAS